MGVVVLSLRCGNRVFGLRQGSYVVGRSSSADIHLDDSLVSRRHCVIHVDGHGDLAVEDLGSRNGILLNGEQVKERCPLTHGDRISVGPRVLVVTSAVARNGFDTVDTSLRATMPHDQPRQPNLERQPNNLERAEAEGETRSGTVYQMFLASAARALEEDDLEAAENLAGNLFVSVRAALARGKAADESEFHSTVKLGLTLAQRTGTRRWVDKVLVLHVAAGAHLAAEAVEHLRTLQRGGLPVRGLLVQHVGDLRSSHGEGAPLIADALRVVELLATD